MDRELSPGFDDRNTESRRCIDQMFCETTAEEMSCFKLFPGPDILKDTGLVETNKMVNCKCSKQQCESAVNEQCDSGCSSNQTNVNPVFGNDFFSLVTDPRTIDFLINLGNYRQEETRRNSFHSKFQRYLNPLSRKWPLEDKLNGHFNSKGKENVIADESTRIMMMTSDLEKENSSAINNELMKCELQKLKHQVLEKYSSYTEVLKEKKQKLQVLHDKLKERNEEKGHDKGERPQNTEALMKVIYLFEETVLKVKNSAQETKDMFEEWKLQITKEIGETRNFTKNTQHTYQIWQEKSESLKEKINLLVKNYEQFLELYSEVFRYTQEEEKQYFNLKSNAEAELLRANEEYCQLCNTQQQDINKIEFNIKRKHSLISALEDTLQRKMRENQSLSSLCEELVNGMKKSFQ